MPAAWESAEELSKTDRVAATRVMVSLLKVPAYRNEKNISTARQLVSELGSQALRIKLSLHLNERLTEYVPLIANEYGLRLRLQTLKWFLQHCSADTASIDQLAQAPVLEDSLLFWQIKVVTSAYSTRSNH